MVETNSKTSGYQQNVERENGKDANQPELFAEGRDYEVAFGERNQLRHSAAQTGTE